MTAQSRRHAERPAGFTITEVLVVVGVLALLAAILLPALNSVRVTGKMTKSMSSLRQIHTWMELYASDNREHVLPSQFDYSDPIFVNKGKVRSVPPTSGNQHEGTWADILWTINDVGVFPEVTTVLGQDYRFDAPDIRLYDELGSYDDNPFRSSVGNTRGAAGGAPGDLPKPYGPGAQQRGQPGFFAANDFFNARPDDAGAPPTGRWYVTGQIRVPEQSMYLVDSYVGEIIEDDPAPYDADDVNPADGLPDTEVDFRYSGVCLMLFLDGHVNQQGPWLDLDQLETSQPVRIRDLTGR